MKRVSFPVCAYGFSSVQFSLVFTLVYLILFVCASEGVDETCSVDETCRIACQVLSRSLLLLHRSLLLLHRSISRSLLTLCVDKACRVACVCVYARLGFRV